MNAENSTEIAKDAAQTFFETMKQPWFIILMMIFFFPAGLVLLWVNKDFTQARKKKYTYWFVGIFGALSVMSVCVAVPSEILSKEKILQANELWDEGKQAEAAILYYEAADWCPDRYQPLLYGRLLDYEASRGNHEGVKEVLKHRKQWGGGNIFDPLPLPDCQTPEGKAALEK